MITFHPNHPDNMHCSQAVFRSLFHHFFQEDLSWEQIDKITKTIPGRGSWTMAAHIELAKRGVEVINIEPFDYAKFYEEKLEYLHRTFDAQTVEYYLAKSNLMHVVDDIPLFLELVHHQTKRATVEDVQNLLSQGYLVGAEINSRILNRLPGFSLHYVLIINYDDNEFVLNDPGGGSTPPMEQRRVCKSDFMDALGKGGANGEVTGFRMRKVEI